MTQLLDPLRLQAELDVLKEGQCFQGLSRGYKAPDTAETVQHLIQSAEERATFNSALQSMVGISSSDQAKPTLSLDVTLLRLQKAVQALPTMLLQSYQLDLIQRAVQMEACRCLVVIYDWFCTSGPTLVAKLFELRRTQEPDTFLTMCSLYAPAVNHVYDFIFTWTALHAPIPHRLTHSNISPLTSEADRVPALERMQDLAKIPAHFHGLLSNKSKATLTLLKPTTKPRLTKEYVDRTAQACFMDTLSKQLAMDPMRKIDHFFKPVSGSRPNEDDAVQSRCLARGMILHVLSTECQTEGIFASKAMFNILLCPTYLLVDHPSTFAPKRFAAQMRNDPEKNLTKSLVHAIQDYQDDELTQAGEDLGHFMHERMVEFDIGSTITESCSGPSSLASPSNRKIPRQTNTPRALKVVTLDMIGMRDQELNLGTLGLILRDVLNKARGLCCVHQPLRFMLEGQHPSGNGNSMDDDFTNPIRERNAGHQLLKENFSGQALTSQYGLSNFLVWFGTGQGNATRVFLHQGTFWFNNLADCVTRFTNAHNANLDLEADLAKEGRKGSINKLDKHPSFIKYDNQNLYSTANHGLAVIQTVKKSKNTPKSSTATKDVHSINHKFEPYFDKGVVEKWRKHLGQMLDKNIKDCSNDIRKSWYETWEMITGLGVSGFGSGLTPFQATNAMAFLGLCQRPVQGEMARWIGHNAIGAKSGLVDLGFPLNHHERDELIPRLKAAFMIIYSHLDESLTDNDKELLCWGPIFMEHVLCKLHRWPRLLRGKETKFDLKHFADEAVNSTPPWTAGQNQTLNAAFPFPLTIPPSKTMAWLAAFGYVIYLFLKSCASPHILVPDRYNFPIFYFILNE